MMSRITIALAALGFVAFAGAEASAYVWYTTSVPCDTDNPCGEGLGTCNLGTHLCSGEGPPMRWFRPETTVRVSTVEPEEVPWAEMKAIVDTAFASWVDLPGCKIPQVDVLEETTTSTTITTPTRLNEEPDNIVVFIRTTAEWQALPGTTSTQIALTFIANNPVTGEIVDADIAVNDAFTFTTSDTATSGIDLLSSITHEVGHFFGMAHSQDSTATMYATYGNDLAARTAARTLEIDDTDGICALYEDVPEWTDPNITDPPGGGGTCNAGGTSTPAFFGLAFLGLIALRRRRTVLG